MSIRGHEYIKKAADVVAPTQNTLTSAADVGGKPGAAVGPIDGPSEATTDKGTDRGSKETTQTAQAPTFSSEADPTAVAEHVDEQMKLIDSGDVTKSIAHQTYALPPMLPDSTKFLAPDAEALIAAIPGAKKVFKESSIVASSPRAALWDTLSEMYQAGMVQQLPTTTQKLYRDVLKSHKISFYSQEPGESPNPELSEVVGQEPEPGLPPGTVLRTEVPGLVNRYGKQTVKAKVIIAGGDVQQTPSAQPTAPVEQKTAAEKSEPKTQAQHIAEQNTRIRDLYYGKKKPEAFARLMTAGFGLGTVTANLPMLSKSLRGKPMLWHGTSPWSATSILANPDPKLRGMQLRFAGKAARANGAMLANSAIVEIEKAGIPLSVKQMADLYEGITPRIERQEEKVLEELLATKEKKVREAQRSLQSHPNAMRPRVERDQEAIRKLREKLHTLRQKDVAAIVREELQVQLEKGGLKPKEIADVLKKHQARLSDIGRRVYFGWHPSTVVGWSAEGSEFRIKNVHDQLIQKKKVSARLGRVHAGLLRTPGYALVNGLLGNLPEQAFETVEVLSFKPDKKLTMSYESAGKFISDYAGKHGKPYVVIGARVNPSTLNYMKDFPGLRGVSAALPAVKPILKQVMPNFDPGRDISIAADVPKSNIKYVGVINPETGHYTKIRMQGYTSPKVSLLSRIKGPRKMLLPLLSTALGVDMLRSAQRGKHSVFSNILAGKRVTELRRKAYAEREKKKGLTGGTAVRGIRKLLTPHPVRDVPKSLDLIALTKTAAGPPKRMAPVGPRLAGPARYFGKSAIPFAAIAGATGLTTAVAGRLADKYFGPKKREGKSKSRRLALGTAEASTHIAGALLGVVAVAPTTYLLMRKSYGKAFGKDLLAAIKGNTGAGDRLTSFVAKDPMGSAIAGIGGYFGFEAGIGTGAQASGIRAGVDPEVYGPLPASVFGRPGGRKILEKVPEAIVLPDAAAMGLLPGGVAATMRKYYPGTLAKFIAPAMAMAFPVAALTVLGLDLGASARDVDRRFRSLAAKNHADKGIRRDGDSAKFQQATKAYQDIQSSSWYIRSKKSEK